LAAAAPLGMPSGKIFVVKLAIVRHRGHADPTFTPPPLSDAEGV
jgi:hypothetical protein